VIPRPPSGRDAVQAWLAAAGISAGPVFRAVALGGKVSDAPLADAGHSLRSCDQCGGERRLDLEAQRGEPSQRHAVRLCAAGGSVQGARGSGVPVKSRLATVRICTGSIMQMHNED
jgi:hypothetical protein